VSTLVGAVALLGSLAWLAVWLRRRVVLARATSRLGSDPDDGIGPARFEATPVAARAEARSRPSAHVGMDPGRRRAVLVGIVFVSGLTLWRPVLDLPLPIASALALDGAILFGLGLATRQDRWNLRLEEQLAESLRLSSAGLHAGLGRVEALQRAAAQIDAPLRPILLETVGQLRLGEEPQQVFRRLAARIPLETFRLFTMVIATQWEAGGSLQRTFASVGDFMQDRVEVARRITAQAAPTRSAILTLIGATAAIAWFSGANDPASLERFLRSSWGSGLVGSALALQGASLVWMWRLTRVRI